MKEKHDHDQSSHIATDVLGKQFFGCRHWEIAELILNIKCFHKAMEQKNEEKANEISQRMGPLLYQFSEYAIQCRALASVRSA